jgi:thioredoxin 2
MTESESPSAGSTVLACPNCGTRNRVRATSSGVPRCSVCHTLLPWLVEATAAAFADEIQASVPVVVDFWAPWCGPCRMISPLVERAASEHTGRLKVVKLNIDDAPALADRYSIRGIPQLILFKDGQEADRIVGAVPAPQLQAWLAPHLESATAAGAEA